MIKNAKRCKRERKIITEIIGKRKKKEKRINIIKENNRNIRII